jgi:hypothetical protein
MQSADGQVGAVYDTLRPGFEAEVIWRLSFYPCASVCGRTEAAARGKTPCSQLHPDETAPAAL